MTKEKFLRAIVGDPPQIVEHTANIELESELVGIKSVLKAQKEHVAGLVAELESRGRDLSQRYETISLQSTLLSSLPAQIQQMEETLSELRRQNQSLGTSSDGNPALALPLPATLDLLREKRASLDEINAQLKSLQQALPRQTRALEVEERELRKLEAEREIAVNSARQAVERKQDGGGADELELRGRWLRGVGNGLRGMLEVEV